MAALKRKSTLKRGKSKLKPSSAKEVSVKRKYAEVCKVIDEKMMDEHGYIFCTSCGVRHNGLLGHAHSHNLPKGLYKKYETEEWNISVRCLDCHNSLDRAVFEDIQYFKDLHDIMYWREIFEPFAYNRFVTGLKEVGCDKYDYLK